jgi:hypothetical protein
VSDHFLIQSQPQTDSNVSALVVATDSQGPLDFINEVEKELSCANANGLIVFDLLISHGHKRDRFLTGHFDGVKFSDYNFKLDKRSYEAFSKLAAPILKSHVPVINFGLLSKAMAFAIKRGIPL